jgi:hypothetical protein
LICKKILQNFTKLQRELVAIFLSSSDLFKRILKAKHLQNSFLLKYLLGLSVLSTAACEEQSGDITSSTKLTDREMNLANIKIYKGTQKVAHTTVQDESLQGNAKTYDSIVTATPKKLISPAKEALSTTINSIITVQKEPIVSQTVAVIEPVSQDDNTALIQDIIDKVDIVLDYDLKIGNVIKGPLEHALVFLGLNGDGNPVNEPFVFTKSDGSYDLLEAFRNHEGSISKAEMENANLTVFTYYNTIDKISDRPLPDVILKAPFGSSVISPVTTIMTDAELTNQKIADLLGITQEDFYNFNPFSPSSDLTLALEVETIGLQLAATMTALSGATKGALGDSLTILNPEAAKVVLMSDKLVLGEKQDWTMLDQMREDLWQDLRANLGATEIVLAEIVQIAKDKSVAGEQLDLKLAADIDLIIASLETALVAHLNKSDGASSQNTFDAMASFRARSSDMSSQLISLNTKITGISDLYSKEAIETAILITGLSDKIFSTEFGTWKDKIEFAGISEDAVEKTGMLKPKGSLSAFSSQADSKLWGIQALYADKGKFLVSWTNNDPKHGNEVQLRTIDDPNGTKQFKAITGETAFDFDYSLNEDGSPAIIVMRSYKDASLKSVVSGDFTASDGTKIVLSQPTVAGEIIAVHKVGAPAEKETFIAYAGQTDFAFAYDASTDQVGISRSKVAKISKIPNDEYTVEDGVIKLNSPTDENEIVEIRKLPANNQNCRFVFINKFDHI